MKLYKLSRYFYKNNLLLISSKIDNLNKLLNRNVISGSTKVGQNVDFAYGGISFIIHKDSVIGDNCVIGQNVTIGGVFGQKGVPVIENNVYIGPGARILGDITIGHNSIIAPNAVVTKSTPAHRVIGGIPAKVLKVIDRESFETKYKFYGIKSFQNENCK